MPLNFKRCALRASLAAGCAVLAGASPAFAQTTPSCESLNLPHPVYGNGGSAITADLGKVAVALANLPSPISILYSDATGACTQFQAFLDDNVQQNFHYWTAAGVQADCTPPLAGQTTDFSHMGNPSDACPGITVPDTVKTFPAPVQTLDIVTGPSSSEQTISADALYVIYGFATLAPWTNTAAIQKRSGTSFASLLLAAAIGVPGAAFKGDVSSSTQGDVIKGIVAAAALNANDAIGYVSGSAADAAQAASPSKVKTLAFQAKDQSCGFWPDSGPSKLDKTNVRTGQYALWTPGHFFARVDGSNAIVNQDVANLIDWYGGRGTPPVDVVGLSIDAGDIPLCAMEVTREGLFGAISSTTAVGGACSHYFEKRATGTTSGTACADDAGCTSVANNPKCHHGYCEAY